MWIDNDATPFKTVIVFHWTFYLLFFVLFFFNFTAQNLIPTTFEVDNVSGAAPSSDRLGGRIQFKRGRERGKKKKGKRKRHNQHLLHPRSHLAPASTLDGQGPLSKPQGVVDFLRHSYSTSHLSQPSVKTWRGSKICWDKGMLPAFSEFIYGSFQLQLQDVSRYLHTKKNKNKKKLYTGRIRVFPMFCTIGPIHYLLCRAKYKNKNKKKSTKSARLLAIAPSSISTDQLLEKLRWQSMTHFPGLSVAF